MYRAQLLATIGVVFCWLADARSQSPASVGALSAELRAHVKSERYQDVTSLRGLPLGVRDGLQSLVGDRVLDIGEPGAGVDTGSGKGAARAPIRRLVVAGCSYEHCLVYYERAATTRTWRVVLFHWTPEATRLDWGGEAPGGLRSVDDVRGVVLAKSTEGSAGPW